MLFKRLLPLLLSVILFVSIVGTVAAMPSYGEEWENTPSNNPTVNFTDLPSTHWAYRYIADMVNMKVMDGYPDNKFRPNNTITRAEFAKIMVTASGIGAKKVNYSSFSDVSVTNWASPFIESVKDYMTGYRTANGQYIFNPSKPALREDITVALVKLKGYDVTRLPDHSTLEAMFKDYKGISESAKDYIAIAIENGLVSGYQDETFRPQATVTRAEAAVLLWRAYQYGNDNKDVGGGDGNTSTTTPSVTQPSPNPQPTTPNQPQQPSEATKFSVDTLVGGIGAGDVDGPVYQAKINAVDSMAVDKDDNIYFLDRSNKKVRRFNHSNGTVEALNITDTSIGNKYTLEDAPDFQLLRHNTASNKMYLATHLGDRSDTQCPAIYEISPTITRAAYTETNSCSYHGGSVHFMTFVDENTMFYGVSWNKNAAFNDTVILESFISNAQEAAILGSVKEKTSPKFGSSDTEAFATNDDIWILDTSQSTLTKTHIFPRLIETVATFDNIRFSAVTSYNGNFYASNGTTIYEIKLDGSISIFIDGKDLTYNDGNPIQLIKQLNFDSQGNVIIYDDQNKAIRRINL